MVQEGLADRQKQDTQEKQQASSVLHPSEPQKKPQYSSSEASDEEEDIRDLEGRIYTKMGREVHIKVEKSLVLYSKCMCAYLCHYHLFCLRNFPRLVQCTTVRFHVFTDISSQCWQCEEVQGGDGSRQGRGG